MAVTLKGNNGTYEGTSEDNKPLDVPVNTEFNELDTGKTYYFDGETWNEEPPCEGSGFTPTTEQLAAMNSGITTEDVAQIATNENNILLKADTSNVNTAIDNLQAQIDEIVTPVTQDAEVQNARVGTYGTQYATLKQRLDTENTQIYNYMGEYVDISACLKVGYIPTTTSPVDTSNIVSQADTRYAIIDCTEGDIFRVVGTGGSGYRMWTFVDSNNNIITQAEAQADQQVSKTMTIYAPANTFRLIVNFRELWVSCAVYQYRMRDRTIYIGANRRYTRLRDGISAAIKIPNTKVYVDAGTYDLTEEFAAEIEAAGTSQYGIRLGNGVHIIFSSGAKVEAKYTGGNTNVETYFSPFYANNHNGASDFTLENLDIESTNTRYCIHDECSDTSGAYVHKYINCKMSNDNVNSAVGAAYYPQCIGGGLGQYGYIDIEGCYFKTKRAETKRTTCVSYHNNAAANSKSNINVRDCYFDDYGTFRVTYYGSSTDVSQAIICNCSLGLAPYIEHEQGSTGPENMNLITYNNEIRE